MPLVIFLCLLLVVFLYLVSIYNNLVSLKHGVSRAWANIDVLLKQRHDELLKLVEVCRHYMQFEASTLDAVMQARAGVARARETGNIAALGLAEGELRAGLSALYATVEAYPQLRSSDQFTHLAARITELETSIADRREVYNDAVNANNVRIDQFPNIVIARQCGFRAALLLQFAAPEKSDINLDKAFKS
ncbi:LemA protein [Andreprevotia lacus DSM 23236]|jgi:LemA protein|uniref:LemA protein n=1 Tax=Andreprevotia lacus DSM 23236 TaxID=1121001 RepID=A0A1W1WWQ1_9NEIS|nr:LemA family protein [Andreprevotia lacus]SMC16152.1 LemA protein [Andreprevotia lacus DSM 23236]